jgi:ATP-dependent DNA helicase RecG
MNVTRYKAETEVQFVKGVGPKLAGHLAKMGVATVRDLLYLLPRRYEDRTKLKRIADVRPGETVTLRGRLIELQSQNRGGRLIIIKAAISDGSGAIRLVWFNQRWVQQTLSQAGAPELVVYGQVKEGVWGLQIESPEWEIIDSADAQDGFASIVPVYPLTEKISQKVMRRIAGAALQLVDVLPDPLPASVLKEYGFPSLATAIEQVHRPDSLESAQRARRRLVFEEFFILQLHLCLRHQELGRESGIAFSADEATLDELEGVLPWPLTDAQKRVIGEIYTDMRRPHPMNRLLQGDVGSGKTVVAAAAMLAAIRSGYQAAVMVPTEILAEQHYFNLTRLLAPLGLDVELLVGKLTKRQKDAARERTASGQANIAVGTHALIQEGVEFKRLGLVVVDEQHRFGVMQRASLRAKGYGNPDVLVMTATPIPRTLTLTLYGDLDLSVIDQMPPGRKPIKTHWKRPEDRDAVYEAVRTLLERGSQAYIVCPLIEESEKMQAQAATELFKEVSERHLQGFRVGLLHGQMKAAEKEAAMEAFRKGETQALVSTTVIEVGVDVPNATVMVIEDANRFGLAQLHQLRGRVGRGQEQSYCVLIASATTPEAEERLRALVETTDGFRIAEADLKIRGPGELFGTKQAGHFDFKVADLLKDGKLLEEARQAAMRFLESNPRLEGKELEPLHAAVAEVRQRVSQTDVS